MNPEEQTCCPHCGEPFPGYSCCPYCIVDEEPRYPPWPESVIIIETLEQIQPKMKRSIEKCRRSLDKAHAIIDNLKKILSDQPN
jgi:hypothetical protein